MCFYVTFLNAHLVISSCFYAESQNAHKDGWMETWEMTVSHTYPQDPFKMLCPDYLPTNRRTIPIWIHEARSF